MSLEKLPDDLIKEIFVHLVKPNCYIDECKCYLEDCANLAATCRRLKNIEKEFRDWLIREHSRRNGYTSETILEAQPTDIIQHLGKGPCTQLLVQNTSLPNLTRLVEKLPRRVSSRLITLRLVKCAINPAAMGKLLRRFENVSHLYLEECLNVLRTPQIVPVVRMPIKCLFLHYSTRLSALLHPNLVLPAETLILDLGRYANPCPPTLGDEFSRYIIRFRRDIKLIVLKIYRPSNCHQCQCWITIEGWRLHTICWDIEHIKCKVSVHGDDDEQLEISDLPPRGPCVDCHFPYQLSIDAECAKCEKWETRQSIDDEHAFMERIKNKGDKLKKIEYCKRKEVRTNIHEIQRKRMKIEQESKEVEELENYNDKLMTSVVGLIRKRRKVERYLGKMLYWLE